MPLSEVIQKPKKRDGTLAWKGNVQMKDDADTLCWPEWLDFIDDLDGYTAKDLMMFIYDWYMKVGYSNLGKMVVAAVQAIAKERAQVKA